MANEFTLNGSISYQDDTMDSPETTTLAADIIASIVTKKFIHMNLTVTTSELALEIGDLASLGWFFAINRDPTNFIELRVSSGGAKFAKLKANMFCGPMCLGSGAQAPYAIADTASCRLEYWLFAP